MNKKYHPVVEEIKSLLDQNNCWYETFEHKAVRTSEEAAKIRTGYSLQQGAKALILRVKKSKKDKKFIMIVLPGDQRFDSQKVKELFQAKDIRFATPEEVESLTDGVKVGGVPPFGNLFGLEVVVDPLLLKNEKIIFNAGDRRFSLGMLSKDFKKLATPKVRIVVNLGG